MPIERILSEKDFQTIINRNNKPPFDVRNKAIVISASYWLLTPYEMTGLRLEDVMDKSGILFKIWTLPEYVAQSGEAREIRTSDHVEKLLNTYIQWVVDNKLFNSGKTSYRGLNPKMPFILNDNFEGYSLSKRDKNSSPTLPVTMNKKLSGLLNVAGFKGVTPSSFRDSGIYMFYANKAKHVDLMDFTGIKSKATLDAKIRPHEVALEVVLNNVFKNIK